MGRVKLKFKKKAYDKLINCAKVPPETGGIVMGNDLIIDTIIFDLNIKEKRYAGVYIPNVVFLNETIAQLNRKGKNFYGIFHTHADNWKTLSAGDEKYIKNIMNAMPAEIKTLYFPLVFPKTSVKLYRAEKKNNDIYFLEEKIEIVE